VIFRGLKVSQGKVRTINRRGGISNHLSMAYLLSNICTKITGIGQLLLKLSLGVGWYPFLSHSVDEDISQVPDVNDNVMQDTLHLKNLLFMSVREKIFVEIAQNVQSNCTFSTDRSRIF